ncbi:MAG: hypothetical protein ABR884_02295 [Minisyncoccia bacterium]|jgi:hypothetical protein
MMKKLLFFAALIVAIGSIGGNMVAHAQTLTPAQTAAIQQQLDVANATLANLEMQAGIVPPVDAGTPNTIPASIAGTGSQSATPVVVAAATTELSAAQISAFKTTLSALAATLTQLDASLATNTTLTPSQETAVQATLNGMQGTLVAMANDVANSGNSPVANSAPIAATQPASAPVAVNNMPPSVAAAQTPSTTVVAQTQPAITNNAVPQTAQASSIWSFTKAHWPTIVIVLLVIAILAILFWPEKKEPVRTVSTGAAGSGKPKSAPTPIATSTTTVNFSRETTSTLTKPIASSNVPAPATPVANAVAAPSQK